MQSTAGQAPAVLFCQKTHFLKRQHTKTRKSNTKIGKCYSIIGKSEKCKKNTRNGKENQLDIAHKVWYTTNKEFNAKARLKI
ncbi:MAG: hypothetical protein IJW22_04780 [Clostridia bacterium]|nr:hypothetical protein [Clostridia bacterium]